MLEEIVNAIDRSAIADDAKRRLLECLPWLRSAIDSCGALPDAMLVAAATPRGSQVFAVEGFLRIDEGVQFNAGTVARDLHNAIETNIHGGNIVLYGTILLLGPACLAAALADMAAIAARGERPMVVVLSERSGNTVSVVVTVAPMERRVLH